eukprot:2957251-Amphidinium_carterae.1
MTTRPEITAKALFYSKSRQTPCRRSMNAKNVHRKPERHKAKETSGCRPPHRVQEAPSKKSFTMLQGTALRHHV